MMVVVMQGIIIPTHAPHAGSDLRSQALMVHLGNFNPRPPHARGDGKTFDEMTIDELKFQSPPPMREATTIPLKMMPASLHFNPRLPCGRRRSSISMPGASRQFQSSPPMREATQDLLRRALTIKHFNPRLPCGRRRTIATTARTIFYFNPHLPCGRQLGSVSPVAKSSSFQSPPPMRGATVFGRGAAPGSYISTHAPHAGSDQP